MYIRGQSGGGDTTGVEVQEGNHEGYSVTDLEEDLKKKMHDLEEVHEMERVHKVGGSEMGVLSSTLHDFQM